MTPWAASQLGGQRLETVPPAGDDDEVRAVGGQLLGEGTADAAGRASDEGERASEAWPSMLGESVSPSLYGAGHGDLL